MLEINASESYLVCFRFALSTPQLKSLIGTDMKQGTRKQRDQFGVHALDQVVGLLIYRRQHVSVRSLCHVVIHLVFKHVMQMSKSLLFRQNRDKIFFCVCYQVFDLRWSDCCFFWRDEWLVTIIEDVLHINRE